MGLQEVIEFAVDVHKNTPTRKHSELPYIVHPMAVLSLLGDWEVKDEVCRNAAVLHDTWEECPDVITFQKLEEVAGTETALVVKELTFIPSGPEPHVQKKKYMETFKTNSVRALVVKMADRICNTLDFISGSPDYAPKYWKKAEPLFEAFLSRREEIEKVFGEATFIRMRYSMTNLNMSLVR